MRPAKPLIRLGGAGSESSSAQADLSLHPPRLIWVFAGRTVILLVLSWGGSYFGKIKVISCSWQAAGAKDGYMCSDVFHVVENNCVLMNMHELHFSSWYEPSHDKTNNVACAPSEDSDQPRHLHSLIRVFAVRSMGSEGPKLSSCGQRRLWSDWADAQADLSPRWAHNHIVGFDMRRLIFSRRYGAESMGLGELQGIFILSIIIILIDWWALINWTWNCCIPDLRPLSMRLHGQ